MRLSYLVSVVALPFVVSALSVRDDTATSAEDSFPDFETVQLTEADLAPLNDTLTAVFTFDSVNVTESLSKRTIRGRTAPTGCKVFPGDAAWPADCVWDVLDQLVGGALIKTIPIGAPCYAGPNYDAARCKVVTDSFTNSDIHELDPTSMMSPLYQGMTCMPTANSTASACTNGGFPAYAVNVTNVAQVQLAVNFARSNNIRLVVKNTGHDFSGKSGGAGALSVWTHYLNNIAYQAKYVDKVLGYSGPAFKFGSGVIAKDAYAAAQAKGLMVIGGEGKTVGVFGGWTAGGGHSPMSSLYGMGADQVLSMEAVTADGRFVTASPSKNVDLFWALRGGGGGTFAVVTSVTVRAYSTVPVTVVTFAFNSAGGADNFWAGVRAYFDYFIPFADAGTYSYFWMFPGSTITFSMQPFFAPKMTTAQTQALLKPWFDRLTALGISFAPVFTTYANFYDAAMAGFPQEAIGGTGAIIGSRLFPRTSWTDQSSLNATFAVWKSVVEGGDLLINFNIKAPNVNKVDNAVVPAWRETVLHAIAAVGWAEPASYATQKAGRDKLSKLMLTWKEVSPNAGAYLGECDIEEVDFQKNFFGINYKKLLTIKQAIDPKNVFWVRTGVGSEVLEVQSTDAIHGENGRLCYT